MEKQIVVNYLGEEHIVRPELCCYRVQTAMDRFLESEGFEPEHKEPLYGLALQLHGFGEYGEPAIPTVNLGELISIKDATHIDINNYGYEMVEALSNAGILTDTGLTFQSGFVRYPVCVFTEDFIATYANDAYKMYSDAHDAYFKALEEEWSDIENEDPDYYDDGDR